MATIEKKQADNSRWTFAEETDATGSPVSNKSDLEQRSYVATSFSVDENGEKVESESLRAGFSQVFGELAGLSAGGTIDFEVPEAEGLLPILQAILGDQSPTSTAIPDKTILPAGTPLTAHVIHGESLIGQADKQVLDTMGRFDEAVTLRVTLTSASLISSSTAGTVVVRYDVGGTETNLTASFASTALATPMTLSLPADAKVVKVTTTGFNAGTFDIEAVVVIVDGHDLTDTSVTLANDLSGYDQAFNARISTDSSTAGSGTITFAYTANGTADTVAVSIAAGAATYFAPIPANATINSITVSSGLTGGTADIDAVFPLLNNSFFDNEDTIALGVVRGHALSGTSTITIADDLAEYTAGYQLTVSPSEDATLTGATGTVVINYDTGDDSHTGTLTFATASATTAQTFDLPANSEITSVTRTGWSDGELDITAPVKANLVYAPDFNNPSQVTFAFSAAKANGSIDIRGLRKVGIRTKDWLHLNEVVELDATGTSVTSTKYFRNIIRASILDEDGNLDLSGTITLTGEGEGYETVIKVADRILSSYTIEAEVGEIPRLISGALFTGATIANDATVNISANILAERVDRRRTVESRFDEKLTSTMADNESEFPLITGGFFSGRGGYLEIDGEAIIFNSSPITIDSNYDFADEKNGSIFRPEAERQGRRAVTAVINARYQSGTTTADKFIKWDEKYRGNEPVNARIVEYRWADNGRQKAIIWDLPYCEITEPVRVEATAPGSIPIAINLKATPDPNTTETAEITCTLINDDQA